MHPGPRLSIVARASIPRSPLMGFLEVWGETPKVRDVPLVIPRKGSARAVTLRSGHVFRYRVTRWTNSRMRR
jgi:hypothetical protein